MEIDKMKYGMILKKSDALDGFLVLGANVLVFLIEGGGIVSGWLLYTSLVLLYAFLFRKAGRHNALGIVIAVGGLVLYVFPYLGEMLRGEDIPLRYFSLYLAAAVVLFWICPEQDRREMLTDRKVGDLKVAAMLIISVLGMHVWYPVFAGFYAIALVVFDRCCASYRVSRLRVMMQASLFYVVVLYYILFVWSGFGRLSVLTYLLLPALIMLYWGRVRIKIWQLALVAPVGLVLGGLIRKGEEFALQHFAGGSSSHHLRLMHYIAGEKSNLSENYIDLVGQYALYFLNWFPRLAWPEKPVGIGLWFVDVYIGREGVSEGHSVSLGLWGEHMFLAPSVWLVSGFTAIALSGWVARALYSLSHRSMAVLIIFQANLLTFFWGGLASFGARVWWMILPAMAYILVERWLSTVAGKRRSNGSSVLGAEKCWR